MKVSVDWGIGLKPLVADVVQGTVEAGWLYLEFFHEDRSEFELHDGLWYEKLRDGTLTADPVSIQEEKE